MYVLYLVLNKYYIAEPTLIGTLGEIHSDIFSKNSKCIITWHSKTHCSYLHINIHEFCFVFTHTSRPQFPFQWNILTNNANVSQSVLFNIHVSISSLNVTTSIMMNLLLPYFNLWINSSLRYTLNFKEHNFSYTSILKNSDIKITNIISRLKKQYILYNLICLKVLIFFVY